MNKENKINIHYLGVVKKENGAFKSDKINIDNSRFYSLIEALKDAVNNPNKTILDMQEMFIIAFPPEKSIKGFKYCLPEDYYGSFVEPATYPLIISAESYFAGLEDFKASARTKYIENNPQYNEDKALKYIDERVAEQNLNRKEIQYKVYERYIDSFKFYTAQMCATNSPSIVMYSSDDIGWTTFTHRISEDVEFTVKSNFGYGSSSYFYLNLKYKGIDILPYSDIVKYYKVKMIEFVRYTRSYSPRRESWVHVINRVVETSNLALNSPGQFERENLFNEVDEMMSGLRRIKNTAEYEMNKIKGKEVKDNCSSFIEISNNEQAYYNADPKTSVTIFKAEKISGALLLLDNLSKLQKYNNKIEDYIAEIREINTYIVPEILSTITRLDSNINPLNDELSNQNKILQDTIELLRPHIEALDALLEGVTKGGEINEIRNDYVSNNKHYEPLIQARNDANKRIAEINSEIQKLENAKNLLKTSLNIMHENGIKY